MHRLGLTKVVKYAFKWVQVFSEFNICAFISDIFVKYAASVWVNYLFVQIMQRRRTKKEWRHLVP